MITLRPIQEQALAAAREAGGLLAHIGVGHGKTAICGLLPGVLGARRPLTLVPASAVRQTLRMRDEAGIPASEVWSYERLSHPAHSADLEAYAPDLLVLDEAHMVRAASARRRRLARYIRAASPRVCVLSGTLLRPEIEGTCELARWALGAHSPLPSGRDARGLQAYLCGHAVGAQLHQWIRRLGIVEPLRRLRLIVAGGRGCVVTDSASCEASLRLEPILWEQPPAVLDALEALETTWELPGLVLVDALHLAETRRQLHTGYYYRWSEAPARDWLDARSAWGRAVRRYLPRSGVGRDSEGLLARACERGEAPTEELREGWAAWRGHRSTPPPPTEAVWLDDGLVRDAAARRAPLTWYTHRAEAERFAALGLPVAELGRVPEAGPVAVSVASHGKGANLQWASEGLALAPCPRGETWEQLLGRTHRQGQAADEVVHRVYVSGCVAGDLARAIEEAEALAQVTGAPQRLLWAVGVTFPRSSPLVQP